MAVYYFIITNVRYGTTTSDTTCTRINNDCSGWTTWLYRYKKRRKIKVPGPVWIPIMHLSFLLSLKISLILHIWTEERETLEILQAFIGSYPKTRIKWRQGTEDLASKRCWWAPSQLLGGNAPSPSWKKECLSCILTGPTQLVTLPFIKLSSDTSEICWH